MSQHEDFIDKEKPNFVCKFTQTLYDLRQKLRAQFEKLKKFVND